jgi:hypothetical protein
MKEVTTTVYEASDGTRFPTSKACLDYENELVNVTFFRIIHCPDLTEGRGCQKNTLLIVKGDRLMSFLWGELYCETEFGTRIAFVQGVAITENWKIIQIEASKFQAIHQQDPRIIVETIHAGDTNLIHAWEKSRQ